MECPNCKACINTCSPPIQGPKVPCVICFVPVTEWAPKSKIFVRLTDEDKERERIFQWFLLNFWIDLNKKDRKKMIRGQVRTELERYDQLAQFKSVGWDGEGGKSPPLPFCEECKKEVVRLMKKKEKIQTVLKKGSGLRGRKEEEDSLKEGIRQVKRVMAGCEAEFVESGIYEEDKRYQRVRKYIIRIKTKKVTELLQLELEERVEQMEVAQNEKQGPAMEVPKRRKRRPAVTVPRREKRGPAVEVFQREKRGPVMEVPCVICCATLKIFPEEKKTMAEKDIDKRTLRWFLKHLQNPQGQVLYAGQIKSKNLEGEVTTTIKKEMWDEQGGRSEPLQFCGGCRDGILKRIELGVTGKQRATDIRKIRRRMKECEEEFEKCGIYEKDRRYFNVRRKVVKILEKRVLPQKKNTGEVERVLKKNWMDKILEEVLRKNGAAQQEQLVEIVMKTEEDQEEMEEDWQLEEGDEEPPIIEQKLEMNLEIEDPQIFRVKSEKYLEDLNNLYAENDNDPQRNCLLCYKEISKEESALAPVLTDDLNEQNFNSVFILRKMLNVPKQRLTGYVEKFGCPGKWVEYCNDCFCLVDEGLRIQKQISELEDKLRKCQGKMICKIKTTFKSNNNSLHENSDEITRITQETRQFVNMRSGKKLEKIVPRVGYLEEEVRNDAAKDNEPLESSLPPPIPLVDGFDPIYNDCSSEVPVDIKPSSAKKLKLSSEEDTTNFQGAGAILVTPPPPNISPPMQFASTAENLTMECINDVSLNKYNYMDGS